MFGFPKFGLLSQFFEHLAGVKLLYDFMNARELVRKNRETGKGGARLYEGPKLGGVRKRWVKFLAVYASMIHLGGTWGIVSGIVAYALAETSLLTVARMFQYHFGAMASFITFHGIPWP